MDALEKAMIGCSLGNSAQAGPLDAGMWGKLPTELALRVVSLLPDNEVACTARLLCKRAAAAFRARRTVRLSQAAPHAAFTAHWLHTPGATRSLTLLQRQQLISLTAASGDVTNLEAAVKAAGCPVALCAEQHLLAAAGAGQLATFEWLLQHGCCLPCPETRQSILEIAARAGQRAMCEWLLAHGYTWHEQLVLAAAEGGHEDLTHWLLERPEGQLLYNRADKRGTSTKAAHALLTAAARGFDLAALQRLHAALWPAHRQQASCCALHRRWLPALGRLNAAYNALAAAVGSPTPDWQAKAEWLASLGFPVICPAACEAAAGCPAGDDEAVARLQWLLDRRCTADVRAALAAIAHGNAQALHVLLSIGHLRQRIEPRDLRVLDHTPPQHVLGVLRVLAQHGIEVDMQRAHALALRGDAVLPALQWLAERKTDYTRTYTFLGNAARSGGVRVLEWLSKDERSAAAMPMASDAFGAAAASGCEEVLEWLAERGWSMMALAYGTALRRGDVHTLRVLQRLRCPWSPLHAARIMTSAGFKYAAEVQEWLAAAGYEGCDGGLGL